MANVLLQPHCYTPEEYLALERDAEFKSEYFEGGIFVMQGASDPHTIIGINIAGEFYLQLKGSSCVARSSDIKIRTPDRGMFSYADLTVVCGQARFHDGTKDVLINPKVLVEILSPSSEAFDRGKKFAKYKLLESFTDYILIAQDEPQIDYFIKQPSGDWLQKSVSGMEAEISIASVDCTLRLSDVYSNVTFPPKLEIRDANETQEQSQ